VITPEMRTRITGAIAHRDRETLEKYGRFLQPIAREFADSSLLQEVFQKYLSLDYGVWHRQ
jgi:hypothetical protein